MFSASKPTDRFSMNDQERVSSTVIARGVKVEGDFASQGDVVIEGDVHGHITATGALMIGQEAHIHADVRVGEATIAGHVEGNIIVDKRLVLKATAHILGDVTAQTLSIEEGAVVAGKFAIGAKPAPAETALPSGTRPVRSPAAGLASAPKTAE